MKDNTAYLFVSYTDYKNGKLTGAHRRFLELVEYVSKTANITLLSRGIPQFANSENIKEYILKGRSLPLPKHLDEIYHILRGLMSIKKRITYDYAISFGTVSTICYRLCGYKNIISLFRENLIEYYKVIGSSRLKILYFSIQEIMAVRFSKKIIVQCEDDRKKLIERNKKYCKNVAEKVFIQINNVNASWMNENIPLKSEDDKGVPTCLFIGNFSNPRKGHGILLPAVAKLIERGLKIQLLVIGDGTELEFYQKKYKIYPEIQFLGRQKNIDKYLEMADLMVVPSLIDSCPNTVLESLNAGVAVYGANTGGIPDILLNNQYLFEPNEESIYSFLKNVIETKKYITDSCEQQERKKALTFDWGEKIKEIIEL